MKFNSLKILPNDYILFTDPISNDLIMVNTYFQEKRRLSGIREPDDNFNKTVDIRQYSRCTNEGKYYVWFKGSSILSIVNTESFKFKDISIIKCNFLN